MEQELKETQVEKDNFELEKRKAAEEAEKLRKSIEQSRAALGKVAEVRSSAEASVSGTDRAADLRQSRESRMRMSNENPVRDIEE